MNTSDYFGLPSPFDDSAHARQVRMGLLNDLGVPEQEVVAALSSVYAALFYDALCDSCDDMEQVNVYCRYLTQPKAEQDYRQRFLSICTGYDSIFHPIPESVWWMAGNTALVSTFAEGFLRRLAEFSESDG